MNLIKQTGVVAAAALFVIAMPMAINVANAQVVLDGSGFTVPSATVLYDPNAQTSNFGSPSHVTSGAAYNIYTRQDSNYIFVLLQQNGAGGTSAGAFANLYFGTGASAHMGSDVGFEVTNANVFSPGSNPTTSTVGTGITFATLDGGTAIEFAAPFSYFEHDTQHIGFDLVSASNPDIVLRLSQTFGYSVAGGATYGPDRLGSFVDPSGAPAGAPAPLAGAGLLSFFGAGGITLRKKAKRMLTALLLRRTALA